MDVYFVHLSKYTVTEFVFKNKFTLSKMLQIDQFTDKTEKHTM